MTLRDLLQGVTVDPVAAVPVRGIARHSKLVRPGDLFVAIDGAAADGHLYILEAINRGAAAIVAERLPEAYRSGVGGRACPIVVVRDTKQALASIAARFYGHPSRKLKLIAVTGTNGKTTTTYLLRSMLEAAGCASGLLGTVVYQIGSRTVPSTNTTPGPLELQRYFAQMVGEGLPWCVMEASSHALEQGRLDGLELEAGIFTNLGSDHLDYHKNQDAYAAAKRRLFEYVRPQGWAVVNADDPYGRLLAETIPNRSIVTYALGRAAKVTAQHIESSWDGLQFQLVSPWGTVDVRTPLLGRHNVSNITAAAATLIALGIAPEAVAKAAQCLGAVPGRLEAVPNDEGFNILVDYAHTADALREVLRSLREMTHGQVRVVFGCGGDRDQGKRAVMGRVASQLADQVVLTSDNPRSEDPMEIIRQIQSGFVPSFKEFDIVPDREQAIVTALAVAQPGDTVLIAGKGHEAYQVFQHVSVPFHDREIAERWLARGQQVAVPTGPA